MDGWTAALGAAKVNLQWGPLPKGYSCYSRAHI